MSIYDTHVPDPMVRQNGFIGITPNLTNPPTFDEARRKLPHPQWEGHPDAIECYWKAWELAFGNLSAPSEGSGFVSPYIETAFNDCLFMWDSAFAIMFGRYGSRVFNFQQTLDNLYARQHSDGYICREIGVNDGIDRFERFDPSSTGPNVMPWSEWEYYCNTADRERLARVFPVLLAYTRWFRKHRTWPDGTYWTSGWGCGMDNQPRLTREYKPEFDHGHMSFVDITCQQVLADRVLVRMAEVLGRGDEVGDLTDEADRLSDLLNRQMWNDEIGFYVDRYRDGSLSSLKTIGAFWALFAGVATAERVETMVGHLENPSEFNRPHRVPTLSADHPAYDPEGGYWLGAVWAPTNYMVLRGLTSLMHDGLAHDIGINHLDNVVAAFMSQGTLFENYAPEKPEGKYRTDFVGWTGLPPIAVLFEYVFGLRPDSANQTLVWDVRLTESHGVRQYPFAADTTVDLLCETRSTVDEEPHVEITANLPLRVELRWQGGTRTMNVKPSDSAAST